MLHVKAIFDANAADIDAGAEKLVLACDTSLAASLQHHCQQHVKAIFDANAADTDAGAEKLVLACDTSLAASLQHHCQQQ